MNPTLLLQVPGMLIKVTGPLWYHMLTYSTKISLVGSTLLQDLLWPEIKSESRMMAGRDSFHRIFAYRCTFAKSLPLPAE